MYLSINHKHRLYGCKLKAGFMVYRDRADGLQQSSYESPTSHATATGAYIATRRRRQHSMYCNATPHQHKCKQLGYYNGSNAITDVHWYVPALSPWLHHTWTRDKALCSLVTTANRVHAQKATDSNHHFQNQISLCHFKQFSNISQFQTKWFQPFTNISTNCL